MNHANTELENTQITLYGDVCGNFIGSDSIVDVLDKFQNAKVEINIKVIDPLPRANRTPEPTINFTLKDVVLNIDACNAMGYNPWCLKEGADGDEIIKVPLSIAKTCGLI